MVPLPLTESHIPLSTSEKYVDEDVDEQRFSEAKQCNPEVVKHDAEPHWHAALFAVTPSV